MNRHPRTPALIVVIAAAALGVLYVAAWGRVEQYWKRGGNQTLEALEKRIAEEGKQPAGVTPAAWRAYADALMDAKQYAQAAKAYKEVIALQPSDRSAKFQCGLALALAGTHPPPGTDPTAATNEFYDFQQQMVYGEAKVAADLFDRPELQHYLKQDRFASLAKEAKIQVMD